MSAPGRARPVSRCLSVGLQPRVSLHPPVFSAGSCGSLLCVVTPPTPVGAHSCVWGLTAHSVLGGRFKKEIVGGWPELPATDLEMKEAPPSSR